MVSSETTSEPRSRPGIALALGAVLLLVWVGWWWAPVRLPLTARVPGADRPAEEAAAATAGGGGFLTAGTLTPGPGKLASLPGAWTRFRGPRLDGISDDSTKLARTWPSGKPRELWAIPVGEGYAGPIIDQGRVYLMDYDREKQRDALRCLSLADGAELWRFSYPMVSKRNHGITRTVPTLAGGRVVAMGPKCHVFAVDAVTGQPSWGLDLVRDFGTTVPPWYAGQCPLVEGDLVILAPGGPEALLVAVELATGKVRWRTPNPNGWKMTHVSVVPVTVGGERYYLYCGSGGVVAVAARDGALAWETSGWKINIATVPSPVVLNEGTSARVFFTGGYNAGSALYEFKAEAGKLAAREVFRLKAAVFGATQHSPVWFGGHLYGTRADGRFVCLSPEGQVVWDSGPNTNFGLGPQLLVQGLAYVLNDDGHLTLLEATPAGYHPLAQAQVLEGIESWGPMALAGGRLLVRDLTRLACLQVGE